MANVVSFEYVVEILYSARIEICLFFLAYSFHRILFGTHPWKLSTGKTTKVHIKEQPSPTHAARRCSSRSESNADREPKTEDGDEAALEEACQAAYARGDFRAVLRYWSTIRRGNQMVSAASLTHVVESMQRFKKESSAILAEVRGYLRRHGKTCDVTYLNHLLDSLGKSLDAELVMGLVKIFDVLNLTADPRSYEALIQMQFATRNFKDVARLEQEMQRKGLKPTAKSSLILLKSALQMSDFDKAIHWYHETCSVGSTSPNTASTAPEHITAQLVELACQQQRVDMVLDALESGRAPLTTESFNMMLSECSRAKDAAMMERIESLAVKMGTPKNDKSFQLLTRDAGNEGAHIVGILEEMSLSGNCCSPEVVQSIVKYCTQSGDKSVADRLYAQLRQKNVAGSTSAFCVLLRFYADAGEPSKACDIYEQYLKPQLATSDAVQSRLIIDSRTERHLIAAALQCGNEAVTAALLTGSPSDTGKHINLIRNSVTKGNLDEAMTIFRALEKNGADMTNSLWNTALDACVECQNMKRMDDLMARMEAEGVADVVSYNTLIKAHLRKEDFDRARACMDKMRKAGTTPNHVTYNEFIHALSKSEHRQWRAQIWDVVDEMRRNGLQPNRITSSILLKSLHPRSPHTDVMRTMELTDSLDEPMDEVLLSSVVEACVRVGKSELLTQTLEKHHRLDGIKITGAHTFGSLIRAYGQAKDVASAWRCWREMRSQHVKPTSITIGCMVEAVVTNGDVDGGYELISDLLDDPMCKDQVNSIVYGSLIKGYSHARRFERVTMVFEEMLAKGIEPVHTTYNTVIDACARNSQMDKVPSLIADMKKRGLQPNLITYSTMIKGFIQQGDMPAAISMFEDLRANRNLKVDEIVYNTILDGCFQAGLVSEGERLFQCMQDERIAPSNYTLSCMVKLLGQARQLDRAFQIVEATTRKYRFKPNSYVNGALLQAALTCKDVDRAVAMYEQMTRDGQRPDKRLCCMLVRTMLGAGEAQAMRAVSLLRGMLGLSGIAFESWLDDTLISEVLASLRTSSGSHGATLATTLLADLKASRPGFVEGAVARGGIDRRQAPNGSRPWRR